jgi:hypothetical protein
MGSGAYGQCCDFKGATVFCELFHDISWHSEIDMVFLVVPFQCSPAIRSPVQSSTISYVSLHSALYKC